jgi:hypothetical protein
MILPLVDSAPEREISPFSVLITRETESGSVGEGLG